MTNGWGFFAEGVGFRKIGTRVYIRGGMSAGTAGVAAFTLPTGYRPSQQCIFACWNDTNTVAEKITIATTGTVTLDGISFDTV